MHGLLSDIAALKGQVVFVTGASRGVGRATALALVRRGAHVVAAARDEAQLRSLSADMESGDCMCIRVDVRAPQSVFLAVKQTIQRYERIDVLINNAGVVAYGPIEDLPLDVWNDILSTNMTGAYTCVREVVPFMKHRHEGHVVNIASHAGLYGLPNLAAYSASKFGLVGLSESLGRELMTAGIRVSCVCPPAVDTGMMDPFPADLVRAWSPVPPEQVAERIVATIEAGSRRGQETWIRRRVRQLHGRNRDSIIVWNSWD